jgi:serine phosphatase RsbU (regulator of sigma subunit)/anti-sigma regulatory factor (Ser/Thr protein kinase)
MTEVAITEVGEWLSFLTRATATIGASLNIEQVATGLAEAAVPDVADGIVVYVDEYLLRESEGSAVLWRGGAMRCLASGGDARAADLPAAVLLLVAQGQTTRLDRVAPDWVASVFPAGAREAVLVPLRVRSTAVGFAVWARREGTFGETELLVARQLAQQAALNMHNAYLYRREVSTVDILQRSMLPAQPPDLAGIQLAHRYLPGNPDARVGGDWFDIIPLRGGRIGLVIGDVAGHGMRSAATMGLLRTATRALATLDLPPEEVLQNLDAVALFEGDTLATCLYCVYDPVARQCSIANAGHLPPVLAQPGQAPRRLEIAAGAPLGVGGIRFGAVDVGVPDGSLLVLCTDGLLERRDRDVEEGLDALCTAVETLGGSLDKQCDSLLDTLGAQHRDDDVALVAARLLGIPADRVANWIVAPSARAPRIVRGMARGVLDRWGLSESADVIVLLVDELVANAVRYAHRPISVKLMFTGSLVCEVRDDDHHLPVLRHPAPSDETGRGIFLVSRLARRWGASRLPGGKIVWFEV